MRVAIEEASQALGLAAVERQWPGSVTLVCPEVSDVLAALRAAQADAACLVVEQSDTGFVSPTWQCLLTAAAAGELQLVAELLLPLPGSESDSPQRQSRFLAVARSGLTLPLSLSGVTPQKTVVVVWPDAQPGALAQLLQLVASRGLNLTSLQLLPEPATRWSYRCILEVAAGSADPGLQEALESVAALAPRVRVLGSYAAWQHDTAVESSTLAVSVPTRRLADLPLFDRRQRPEGTKVQVGGVEIGGARQVLIAGPCSVESEAMLLETARGVAQAGADLLRGGAFKPRTSPYDFQGLGVQALKYLARARAQTGLPVVSEVLSWEEVPLVARYADMLQVGARNMQNLALLRAVGRCGKPVLLKRGGGATIEEWLHAAECILAQGNPNVVLCERGIRTFERATRHTLDLNAVALVRERTHLPVIADPSHAAGMRSIVPALALASLAAGAHGVIVEVHPEPDLALSDGPQSLDIARFSALAAQIRGHR